MPSLLSALGEFSEQSRYIVASYADEIGFHYFLGLFDKSAAVRLICIGKYRRIARASVMYIPFFSSRSARL